MSSKCSEALALRRAFPQELSGLYTADEMSQADSPAERTAPVAAPVEIAAPAPLEHDPVTGETGPRTLTLTAEGGWMEFGRRFIAGIKTAESSYQLVRWISLNAILLDEMTTAAPRPHGSVVKAIAVMKEKLAAPIAAAAEWHRLPAKESQQLRRALVKRLAECQTLAQVDAWRAASEEGIASLQDEDLAGVAEWEATRREQLTEVAEVVG
jgi:hypothetical protein